MPNMHADELDYALLGEPPRESSAKYAMSEPPAVQETTATSSMNVAYEGAITRDSDTSNTAAVVEVLIPSPNVKHSNIGTSNHIAPTNGIPTPSSHVLFEHSDKPSATASRSFAEVVVESLGVTPKNSDPTAVSDLADHSYYEEADHGPSTTEKATETLISARNSLGPAIVPDFEDYAFHDEDDYDDASIQHGGEYDTISVADYQSERIADSHSQAPASTSARNDVVPGEGVLPAHLNDLLEKWYARHGRIIPKCVCRRSKDSMSDLWCRQKSREPVTWLHRSGVPLNVTWYYLPGWSRTDDNLNHEPKLVVVSGPGVPPSIVTYKNAGGSIMGINDNGVVYRVWQGLAGDRDGFESSPSVIKMSRRPVDRNADQKVNAAARRPETKAAWKGAIPGPKNRCNYCILHRIGCDGQNPACGKCTQNGRICVYHEFPISRTELEELMRKENGDGLVMKRSERTRKPNARYNSEHIPPSRKRKAEEAHLDDDNDNEQSDVLLSTFMVSPPLTTMASPASSRSIQSKKWACYLCDIVRGAKDQLRYHIRTQHGIQTPDEARIQLTDRFRGFGRASSLEQVRPQAKLQNAGETHSATEARATIRVRDAGTVRSKVVEGQEDTIESELDEYVKINTRLMFFSFAQAPRSRLFAACDSVHKLFAQATAGSVFTREKVRVLAIEVEDQDGELPVVEDDEEDFQHFVTQLRNASCWTVQNGEVSGDTVVYVREKRK